MSRNETKRWRPDASDYGSGLSKPGHASTWKFKPNKRYEIVDLAPGEYTVVGVCTMEDGSVLEKSHAVSLAKDASVQADFYFR